MRTQDEANSGVRFFGPSTTNVSVASISCPSGTSPYQRTKEAPAPGTAVTVAVVPEVK